MPKCKNCNNLYNLSNKDDVIVGKWCPKINDSPHLDMERNEVASGRKRGIAWRD